MKKALIVLIAGIIAVGAVSAQGFSRGAIQAPQVEPVASSIEGKLALVQGRPALIVRDKTYYLRMPQTLYGFIDGLKEGASVKLEGLEIPVPLASNTYFFQVNKLTIGSKTYDMPEMARNAFADNRRMPGGHMGNGSPRGGRGNR